MSRLPQIERAPVADLPSFRLTQRDEDIILAVYHCRALTTQQIETLFFPPQDGTKRKATSSRCVHRLKLLYHYGFLSRFEQATRLQEGRKPLVYMLDEKGAELVAGLLGVARRTIWKPSDNQITTPESFFPHLLAVNDVRIAVSLAAKEHGWTVEQWIDDRTLRSKHWKDYVEIKSSKGKKKRLAVVPDGYFVLHLGRRRSHNFLEVDRRTLTVVASSWENKSWKRKISAYLEYYRSGLYQKKYDTESYRILTVTTGERRLANMKVATEEAGGLNVFWFTTFDLATSEDILTGPVWYRAGYEDQKFPLIS